jgi:hypothetical protein
MTALAEAPAAATTEKPKPKSKTQVLQDATLAFVHALSDGGIINLQPIQVEASPEPVIKTRDEAVRAFGLDPMNATRASLMDAVLTAWDTLEYKGERKPRTRRTKEQIAADNAAKEKAKADAAKDIPDAPKPEDVKPVEPARTDASPTPEPAPVIVTNAPQQTYEVKVGDKTYTTHAAPRTDLVFTLGFFSRKNPSQQKKGNEELAPFAFGWESSVLSNDKASAQRNVTVLEENGFVLDAAAARVWAAKIGPKK